MLAALAAWIILEIQFLSQNVYFTFSPIVPCLTTEYTLSCFTFGSQSRKIYHYFIFTSFFWKFHVDSGMKDERICAFLLVEGLLIEFPEMVFTTYFHCLLFLDLQLYYLFLRLWLHSYNSPTTTTIFLNTFLAYPQ